MPGERETAWLRKHVAQHAEDWDKLLQQPWGRRLLFALIDEPQYCFSNASTAVDGNDILLSETQQVYSNGKRDVGLSLIGAAQRSDSDLYARMISEAMNERRLLLNARAEDARAAENAAKEQP